MELLLATAAGAAGIGIWRRRKKKHQRLNGGVVEAAAPNQSPYGTLRGSQIRLLQLDFQSLQDTHDDDNISGELIVADLDSMLLPQFTALSYAWGSEETPCQVYISGHTINITENLFAVLRSIARARSSNTMTALTSLLPKPFPALMWIDAICINQKDKAEKTSQVRMMARIYSSAFSTVMSLGVATNESRLALDWCTKIAGIHQATFDSMTDDTKINKLFNETAWNALCDLILRPYFRRRWIIEEAALSPDP